MPIAQEAIFAAAMAVVSAVEALSGMPMVMVQRTDDPSIFWETTNAALCQRTNRELCGVKLFNVENMKANTDPLGSARSVFYQTPAGRVSGVCLIMPPKEDLSASYAATVLSSGSVMRFDWLPQRQEVRAWLLMNHAARCLDHKGDGAEERRADAFSSSMLALIQGSTAFTDGVGVTPARRFGQMRNGPAVNPIVNAIERSFLDIWKQESKASLDAAPCIATVSMSTTVDTPAILRDQTLGYTCGTTINEEGPSGTSVVRQVPSDAMITDGNLHLWMRGYWWNGTDQIQILDRLTQRPLPVVGEPPVPWTPFKPFTSARDAVLYSWRIADIVSGP
jgi:hypothetical protein